MVELEMVGGDRVEDVGGEGVAGAEVVVVVVESFV